jgi:hypothetical protein
LSGSDTNERDPVYRLARDNAARKTRETLAYWFGRFFTERSRPASWVTCDERISSTKIRCGVGWVWPRRLSAKRWRSYEGTVTINRLDQHEYRYALRVKRVLHPCRCSSKVIKRTDIL